MPQRAVRYPSWHSIRVRAGGNQGQRSSLLDSMSEPRVWVEKPDRTVRHGRAPSHNPVSPGGATMGAVSAVNRKPSNFLHRGALAAMSPMGPLALLAMRTKHEHGLRHDPSPSRQPHRHPAHDPGPAPDAMGSVQRVSARGADRYGHSQSIHGDRPITSFRFRCSKCQGVRVNPRLDR